MTINDDDMQRDEKDFDWEVHPPNQDLSIKHGKFEDSLNIIRKRSQVLGKWQ